MTLLLAKIPFRQHIEYCSFFLDPLSFVNPPPPPPPPQFLSENLHLHYFWEFLRPHSLSLGTLYNHTLGTRVVIQRAIIPNSQRHVQVKTKALYISMNLIVPNIDIN